VQNKVIGYYELWRANGGDDGACGIMSPKQIPVEYLDQVNVAFAFIDPWEFNIIAMDNNFLDADLYQRVVDLKTRNPNVKAWISVGGWTFNDPGIFQSVFRRIAGSDANTLIFTHNLMAFLFKYSFDGVDIDWEYPGADDRGSVPEDVVTFPRMLRTLNKNLQGGNIYAKS
jgi:chitinase